MLKSGLWSHGLAPRYSGPLVEAGRSGIFLRMRVSWDLVLFWERVWRWGGGGRNF